MRRLLPLLLILTGCATTRIGRKIDLEIVATFEEGKTTEDDVVKALGKPFQTTVNSEGRILSYYYNETRAHVTPATFIIPGYTGVQADGESQMVTLQFRDGVLVKKQTDTTDIDYEQ